MSTNDQRAEECFFLPQTSVITVTVVNIAAMHWLSSVDMKTLSSPRTEAVYGKRTIFPLSTNDILQKRIKNPGACRVQGEYKKSS